jgi:poly(glycerol-phosphate) alpha-glucosyltransferase
VIGVASNVAELRLPEGRYLSCAMVVKPGSGGQTRAMLQRNRIFQEEAGVSPAILAFEPAADYAERRWALIEDDLITEDMCLLNIYDYYRARSVRLNERLGEHLARITGYATSLEHYPDGSPFRTLYADRITGQPVCHDYHRSDGSVFARIMSWRHEGPIDGGPRARLVNPGGEVARTFPTLSDWFKHWMEELTEGDQRVFAFVDSRFVLPRVVPMTSDRFYMIYVLHNIHLRGKRHWNSEIGPVYQKVFKRISHLDALVTLTARQNEDLAQRFGATSNLFVVPNPIRPPVRPDRLPPRDPHRLAAVGRLERQKGFDDAIRAMAIIRKRVPTATLDIYGEGSQREVLTNLITRLHLNEAVTLHGHVVGAHDRLWTATALLMPSRHEGYPLASLESLAHGCPVIAYDVRYGPREQISPGLDGFLVPPGDFRALARRAIAVLTHPDLAMRLSAGGFRKADLHGPATFVADWLKVLESVLALRGSRTHIGKVSLRVGHLGAPQRWKVLFRWLAWLPAARQVVASYTPSQIILTASLRVDGCSTKATLDQAVIHLDAISEADGAVTAVPLTVWLSRPDRLRLSSNFDLADVLARLGPQVTSVQLRLRLIWQNSSWETFLPTRYSIVRRVGRLVLAGGRAARAVARRTLGLSRRYSRTRAATGSPAGSL